MATDLTWPADRMAKFIDVTPRRLAQLVQEGVVERVERGRYNPFLVTVAYIRWLRDQRSSEGPSDEDKSMAAARDARSRKHMAEAETAEIEAAERRGTLMLTANHLRWVKELGTRVRAVVMESKLSEESKKALLAEIAKIKIKQ